ncbi:potassium channel family protein [Bradyrhizobium sp. Y36]|uniref:potassium channel family protein n=1 Tax=Bradyrhizobium sp. Y36 TaxID=2035447 RepID=UPI0018E9BA80|nr:potassium channel family protein [Bradyrhizobium sp. Y36]
MRRLGQLFIRFLALVDHYTEALLFILFPMFSTLALGLILFFLRWDDFTNQLTYCWWIMILCLLTSLALILGFFVLEMRPGRSFWILLAQQIALIFVFAAMYRGYGLMYGGAAPPPLADGSLRVDAPGRDALYFSIVTWTTLGYGDFTALPEMRLIAGIEALTGYVFFGLIVGLATQAVSGLGRSQFDS